jgi:hypothetical protein
MGFANLSCARIKSYPRRILERLEAPYLFQPSVFILGYDNLCVGIVGGLLHLLSIASAHQRGYGKHSEQANEWE